MSFFRKVNLALAVLLLAGLACSGTDVFAPDQNAVNTSVAQTVSAMISPTFPQAMLPPTLESTPTVTATFTLVPPTPLDTLTTSPTETQQAFTPTSNAPLVSVGVDTNCRSGPGKVYDMEGALVVGETAEVYGRDPTSNYWYIRNPDGDPEYCWVWGEYATFTGTVLLLPAFTPPPTPTATITPLPKPGFSAEYAGLDNCAGNWWVEIKLKNTGALPLKSVEITIKDKLTDGTHTDIADGFTNLDGCTGTTTKDILKPGDTYLLSSPQFSYNLTGHKIAVTITICTETGQQGLCVTNKFDFTP